MYTYLLFLPEDYNWKPTSLFLSAILSEVGTTAVDLSYRRRGELFENEPFEWLNECVAIPERPLWRGNKLAPQDAIIRLMNDEAVYKLAIAQCLHWSGEVEREINDRIHGDIASGYVPWDLHFTIGPRDILDPLGERVIRRTQFCFSLSGDGMPSDLEEYHRLALTCPHIQALLELLGRESGQTWTTCIYANF